MSAPAGHAVSRRDTLKSFLRGAVQRGLSAVADVRPGEALWRRLAAVLPGGLTIDEQALSGVVAELPAVEHALVRVRDGAIHMQVTFSGGAAGVDSVGLCLRPEGALFAARGPKELRLSVEPVALAADGRCRDLVGALCGEVAFRLWGSLARGDAQSMSVADKMALVDGDQGLLSCDLRSVPFLREGLQRPAVAMAIELFSIRDVLVEDGAWRIRLQLLPQPLR